MERKVTTKLCFMFIGILFGLPIGSTIALGIMGIVQHPDENPRVFKFGDITIFAITHKNATNEFAEQLLMMKNGTEFLSASRNSLGNVTSLVLAKDKEHIIFSLKASSEPGKWKSARYGFSEHGIQYGDEYEDRNFDGRFDTRVKFNRSGKARALYIRFSGNWKQVDRFQGQKAFNLEIGNKLTDSKDKRLSLILIRSVSTKISVGDEMKQA